MDSPATITLRRAELLAICLAINDANDFGVPWLETIKAGILNDRINGALNTLAKQVQAEKAKLGKGK